MGFQLPSAPPPPCLPVDMSTQTPLTGCAWVKQGLGPFPGLVEGTWSCWTPSWFRDETQGVCSVLSWRLSTFSRAMYQDADIYLLDDLLSAVDATVSRHLFEKWVCSCFLSFLLSKSPVEMKEESSGRSLCSRRLSSLCPGVPLSPPFPPQKIHCREILPNDEVRTGKYSRCFQCVGASGVHDLGSDRQIAVSLLLFAVDYQTLQVDPDPRNKKDDVGFLNQRVRLYNLVLGCQFFFLHHLLKAC